MDTSILIFLGVAVAIILLAILLGRLIRPSSAASDKNARRADGEAAATWIGINRAGSDDHHPGDQ
ncbi:MAG: hypothetical protein WBO55_09635 [Rhizobiaceae bacterium]